MPSWTLRVCVRRRRWVGPSRCRHHACLTAAQLSASACVCLAVCACAVPPRSAVATRTPQATRESPHGGEACLRLFCAGANVVACTEGVRAPPSVGRSLTLSPPRMFDGGADVCVCLCACMPACAGAVTPRSAVAPEIRRATRKSPSPRRDEACCRFVTAGRMPSRALRACVRCRRSVPHAVSPPRVFDSAGGVCVCLCTCMPACAGAGPPRWAVANPTSRASCESHPPATKRVSVCFAPG